MLVKLFLNETKQWLMTEEEGKELYNKLCVLDGTLVKFEMPSTGYRGLCVELSATESLFVCNGLISVVASDGNRGFADTHRELERWIIDTAQGKLEEVVLQQITSELK